jgi:hypothetical protein
VGVGVGVGVGTGFGLGVGVGVDVVLDVELPESLLVPLSALQPVRIRAKPIRPAINGTLNYDSQNLSEER